MTPEIKLLMTQAAEAAIRGDADAVQKTDAALAKLERKRLEQSTTTTTAKAEK